MNRGWLLAGLLGLALGHASCRPSAAPTSPQRSLTVGLHAAPRSFDPHLQNDIASNIVLSNVYETLVGFDPDLRIEPLLAESWENPDMSTWRFHLRRDVRFHNATMLRAADVVASLVRAQKLHETRVSGYLDLVATIAEVDDFTVEVKTSAPDPILLNKLTNVFIVPAETPDVLEANIGSGPYRLVAADEAGVTLEAFEGYRRGMPPHWVVRFETVRDRQLRLDRLLSGELDLISRLDPADLDRVATDRVATDAGVTPVSQPGLLVNFLQLRVDRPPFDDLRVRRAVDLALDRQALVARRPGQRVVATQMVSSFIFGFARDLEPSQTEPAQARRLLTEAGHGDGLEVVLDHYEGSRPGVVVDQLEDVGFRIRLRPWPFPELLDRLERGESVFSYMGWLSTTGDAAQMLGSVAHTRTADSKYGTSNWTGYSNPELDALIERSAATLRMVERRQNLEQCMRIVDADKFLIPLFIANEVFGLRADLRWRPRLDGRILASEVEWSGEASG